MEYKKGDRVVVRRHGAGEVVGCLGGSCITVKFDSGVEMHVHQAGVKKESESQFRSEKV